jgi:hypothetical protein
MSTPDFTKFNPRKQRYIDGRSQGLSKREAKNLAGYAASTSTYSVENSSVKAALARLIKQAVPAHVMVRRIAEGVSACETKFFQKEGIVTDQRDVVAWSERREYLKLAAEYGQYVEPDAKVSIGEVRPTFVLINGITKPKGGSQIANESPTADPGTETHVTPEPDHQDLNHASSFVLINGITGGKTNAR